MSKIAKDNLILVSEEDILRDYTITQDSKIGSETEHIVLTRSGGLITAQEHLTLYALLKAEGIDAAEEPLASIFELQSAAYTSSAALIHEMTRQNAVFNSTIQMAGYSPLQTGYLGRITLQEAMAHRMPDERADHLLEHFIATGHDICARQPLLTSSVHLSISYTDIDHAFEIAKLMMVLTPPLTALCENAGKLFDGKKRSFNPATTIRLSQQDGRGGLSPVIAAAADPEDLMRRQAHHIFSTPMMMHHDKSGTMRVTDAVGRSPSLRNLTHHGLNTASNAMLSESMQYHLLKFTSLRDEFGNAAGKRLELRFADNGPFQHDLLALLGDAITFDDQFRKKLTYALTEVGLNPYDPKTGAKVENILASVAAGHRRVDLPHRSFLDTPSEISDIAYRLLHMLEDKFGESDSLNLAAKSLRRDRYDPCFVPLLSWG